MISKINIDLKNKQVIENIDVKSVIFFSELQNLEKE